MITSPRKPVFIVGCPRSGTTWLYHLLLASGSFAIYRSESQVYSRFGSAFGNFRSLRNREAFLQQWLNSEYFHRSGLERAAIATSIVEHANSPGDVLRALMEGICAEQHATRWAECTPDNALYVQQIKRDFPDAVFIHIVRDGRDVALSLARQAFVRAFPWHRHAPEIAAAAYWAWIVDRMDRAAAFLGDDLLTIRYEDLLSDLEVSLLAIGQFIDKPMDPNKIHNNPIGSIKAPNTSFAESSNGNGETDGPRWKSMYDPTLLSTLECLIGPTLRSRGYAPASDDAPATRKLRSTASRLTYNFRFRAGELVRSFGRASISIPQTASELLPQDAADPTLRPRRNLQQIRKMVCT